MRAAASLFRNTLFSILTNLINRVGNLLLFILILQRMTVASGGVYDLGISFFFIASRFAFWGLDQILTRDVARFEHKSDQYISNFLFARLLLAIIVLFAALAVLPLFNYDTATERVVLVMLLAIVPEAINNLCTGIYAAFEEQYFNTVSTFFGLIIKLGLGVWLVQNDYSILWIASAHLAGLLVGMVANLAIVHYQYVQKWERPSIPFLRSQWSTAAPFFFIGMFYMLDNRFDKVLMSVLSDTTAIGHYAAATSIIVALLMPMEGFRMAVLPLLARYRQEKADTFQTLYQLSNRFALLCVLPLSVGAFLTAPDLIALIYRQSLDETTLALRIMVVALPLMYINILHSRLLIVEDQQRLTALFLTLSTVINLGINLVLLAPYGAIGASIARLVSVVLLFACNQYVVSRKRLNLQTWQSVVRKVGLAALMGLAVYAASSFGLWGQVALGFVVYLGLLVVTREISADERKLLAKLVNPPVS